MNFCAHFTRFFGHPAYKEFNLRDEGLEYVFPDTNEAIVFDDDTSYSGLFRLAGGGSADREKWNSVRKTFRRPMSRFFNFQKMTRKTYLRLTELYKEKWQSGL